MKTKFMMMVACAAMLLATGCKDEKQNQAESIIGNVSKPTWVAPESFDMSSSMTAIVGIDLTSVYTAAQLEAVKYERSADDLLAAFAGETCLGVGKWLEEGDAYWLFIAAPENADAVTIKHYSAALKHVFVSESIPYSNGAHLGSVDEPYNPKWTVAQ